MQLCKDVMLGTVAGASYNHEVLHPRKELQNDGKGLGLNGILSF